MAVDLNEYIRKRAEEMGIPVETLAPPKPSAPPPEFLAAQEADKQATSEAQTQALLGQIGSAFTGRGFQMPGRVSPVSDNVRRYLEARQAAQAATVDPAAILERVNKAAKSQADVDSTRSEAEKRRAETEDIRTRLPKTAADASIAQGLAGPATEASRKVAREYGWAMPDGTNEETARAVLKALDDAKKLQLEGTKAQQAKGEKADKTTADLRKEFQGNQVYKDAQQVASSHAKVQSASPTSAGDIALVYGYMKILDPGSAVREGEYATAANAGGAFQKLGNIYNAVLKGEKLPQKVRDSLKAEATITYQAQMKRYEALAEPYRVLARKAGANPEDVVLPFSAPIDSPPGGGSRPRRTVGNETREWDGKQWVPVGE